MMKKRFAILLAVLMLTLSACGGTASGEPSSQPSEPTGAVGSGSAPAQPSGGSAIRFEPSATIRETVLVDESDVKITATGIKYTAYEVKLSSQWYSMRTV